MVVCWCGFMATVTLYDPFPADSHFYTQAWCHPFTVRRAIMESFQEAPTSQFTSYSTASIYDLFMIGLVWCNTSTAVRPLVMHYKAYCKVAYKVHFKYMNKIGKLIQPNSQDKQFEAIVRRKVFDKRSLYYKWMQFEAQNGEVKVHLIQTVVAPILYMFIHSPAHSYSNHSMQSDFAKGPMDFNVNCSLM